MLAPFLPITLVLAGTAIYVWLTYARPTIPAFLRDFAKLLDHPELVDRLGNRLSKRWFLKGEFRGRKIVILLHRANGGDEGGADNKLVVSMATHAICTMDSYNFADYRPDRETEVALYDLEVKHEVNLRHEDGWLKATWQPQKLTLFTFPGPCDRAQWRGVLEKMDVLAGSLERRAAAAGPDPASALREN